MIQLNNAEKTYPAGASEFVIIMGPSGAGKSTLLAILGMLDCNRGRQRHTVIGQESIMQIPVECASYAPYLILNVRLEGQGFKGLPQPSPNSRAVFWDCPGPRSLERENLGPTAGLNAVHAAWCRQEPLDVPRLRRVLSRGIDRRRGIKSLQAALALHFAYYDFCRMHRTILVTPAMEAGITDNVGGIPEPLR